MEDGYEQVRNVIDCLQRPVHDISTLLTLLCSPLDCINLLPPQFRIFNTKAIHGRKINVRKHIPLVQQALLDHIAPTWDSALAEKNATQLLDQYFCPDNFFFTSSIAGEIALMAYTTIISKPLTKYAIYLLARLSSEYPVDRIHSAVFSNSDESIPALVLAWEDCVRNVMVIPGKVSNAAAGKTEIPRSLEQGTYYNDVSVRTEYLMFASSRKSWKEITSSISYLLARLVNLGVFPSAPPISRSQPSFFQATLPTIRARLALENTLAYSALWSSVLLGLPSSHTLQSILTSLLSSITLLPHATSIAQSDRASVKQEASLIDGIVGKVVQEEEELWESASAVILQKKWSVSHARVFVCWVSGGSNSGKVDERSLDAFIETVLSIWSSADHVKHSFLSQHQYLTSVLLIAISYLSPSSQAIQSLALSPVLISAIGLYIGHLDTSVRLCGMLVAEVVAHRTSKKLDFKVWDGDDSERRWAREMRELLKQPDVEADLTRPEFKKTEKVTLPEEIPNPAVVLHEPGNSYDSDDSITGYASSPSSRSASPTPAQLDEIEKDPTLNIGSKKPTRPVYLAQLGDLLRNTGGNTSANEPHEADKIEMALDCAEELIRKKRGYGTELDENAVNLAYALLGLHNNYELEDFDLKRQGALNALIACAPTKAAPALIEEFFKNQYSTSQRFVALEALTLGAREMANLPIPPSRVHSDRTSFPSKRLPEKYHQHYLTTGEQSVARIMDSISNKALDNGTEEAFRTAPEIVRERRLRVQKAPKVTEVSPTLSGLDISSGDHTLQQPVLPFNKVSTEYFILPLINRFWLFLRDEMTREERTIHREGRERYHGAGTGLILNPLVLAHFLRTLAILVHASHNTSEWLAAVAPDALELAVTIGTRPTSHIETDEDSEEELGAHRGKEASVLTSALELALVVLDGCLEIDGGRVIGLEHTTLLLGVGEWAGQIFSQLEQGLKMQGGGGVHETRLRRAAAGVLLKVDDLTSRWRRSMLDIR